MADISKITLPNGSSYNIKDATARAEKQNIRNGTVSGNVNWDTLTTAGTYKIQNTTVTADYNAPVGEYQYGILVVFDSENGGENRIIQIYFPHRIVKNYMYTRMRNADGWTEWRGLSKDADTVDGKHASNFATVSHTHNYAGSTSAGGVANKAVELVDYADSNHSVKVGYAGPSLTINEFTGFAGFTSIDSTGTAKIQDVSVDTVKSKLGLKSAAYSETSAFAAASHTHTKSQITDFPTSLPANGGTADTAKNLSSFTIPFNRPVANGGNGKQWIKFAEVIDESITTTNRWYGKALEFEIFNNGYGSNGNFVSMGRVSLCVSVYNQKTFTKEAITIKWQNCKPNAYTINHIVAVVTDTKVEFFVLNDVWDTALTFVITRDIGISYGSTYTSTQYTSDDFTTYYSGKKLIQSSLDTNLYVYNSTKVNNHIVETDVPANAKFTDTVYTLPAATSSTLGGVKIGSNITNSSGTISLTKANVTAALGYTPPTTDTTYGVATQSANGLMSSSDKTKLDGIATGANKTTVDSALSSTSTNPVQNKVINSALAGKAAASHTHTTQSAEATSDANASYLRQIATGTAAATTSNCPAGTLYGKY